MAIQDTPRRLFFPLDSAVVLENETPDEPVGGRPDFPVDPEELIVVPVELSADQFRYLASTVDAGRDIAYPNYSQFIWWLWNRIFMATTLCDKIAECIESNEATQAAIRELINQGVQFPPDFPLTQNLPPSRKTQDLSTASNPGCDHNRLFGQCYGIVDLIHDSIVDVNEKLEISSNAVELAQNTVGTIPLVAAVTKAIGIEGALGMINYFQEVVAEGFEGQYTTTPGGVRDEIACAIFCECREDCVITIERVTTVLADRLAVYQSPPSLEGFVNLVETLAGVAVDTTYVVDSAFYAAIGLMNTGNFLYGGKFTGSVFDMVITLKADEPNNDWEILCPCSPVCRSTFEFANQLTSQSIVVGTLDSGGYFDSGVFNSGGGDTAWVIVGCDEPVVALVAARIVLDVAGTYDYGVSWSADSQTELDKVAIERDDGLFEVVMNFDPAITDDVIEFNFHRAAEGDLTAFKILRIELVYEC